MINKLLSTLSIMVFCIPVLSHEIKPPEFPDGTKYIFGTGEHYNNLASCITARNYLRKTTVEVKKGAQPRAIDKKLYEKLAGKCLIGMYLLTEGLQLLQEK